MGGPSPDASRSPVPLTRRMAAEALGAFAITLVAAGADCVSGVTAGAIGHVARYLAPGCILIAFIYALTGVSGAHFNPAITVAFTLRGHFPPARLPWYVAAQLGGALAAGVMLVAEFGPSAAHGAPRPQLALAPASAGAVEAAITALLAFVVLGTAEETAVVGKNAALAVGFTVAALGLVASPLSGASMNPARSLGPALATWSFDGTLATVLGPLAGALIAVGLATAIYGPTIGERERRGARGG